MFSNMDNADMVGNMLAIVFAQLALLFILPTGELTTCGVVVTAQTMYVLLFSFLLWLLHEYDFNVVPIVVFFANAVATGITIWYVWRQRRSYEKLRDGIKEEFKSDHPMIAQYGPIDKQI